MGTQSLRYLAQKPFFLAESFSNRNRLHLDPSEKCLLKKGFPNELLADALELGYRGKVMEKLPNKVVLWYPSEESLKNHLENKEGDTAMPLFDLTYKMELRYASAIRYIYAEELLSKTHTVSCWVCDTIEHKSLWEFYKEIEDANEEAPDMVIRKRKLDTDNDGTQKTTRKTRNSKNKKQVTGET